VESFKIFQGLIADQYEAMEAEFGFTVMDATLPAERTQELVREIVSERIALSDYRWRTPR